MKRILISLFCLLLITQVMANLNARYDYSGSVQSDSIESEYDLRPFNLQIDPVGILFYGPQVAINYQVQNRRTFGLNMRWHYMALFYNMSSGFGLDLTLEPTSYSYGIETKLLFPIKDGPHRITVGIGLDEFIANREDHEENEITTVFNVNVGYRLLTKARFNLSLVAGHGFELSSRLKSDVIDRNYKVPFAQVQLGIQLGKKN